MNNNNTQNSRIKSGNVQIGSSYIIPIKVDTKETALAQSQAQEIIEDAKRKANAILTEANKKGHEIIETSKAQALSEVDAIKQQAYNEGFEAGKEQGHTEIVNELTDLVNTVNDFAKAQFNIKQNITKSSQKEIVELVIEIARKVCSKSLELDENILLELTKNTIKNLKDKENITIIVNPEMAEKIYAISEEMKTLIPQLESIKIIEDNSVSPDGTIVESPLSRVDGRISSQINEIANSLLTKIETTQIEDLEQND